MKLCKCNIKQDSVKPDAVMKLLVKRKMGQTFPCELEYLHLTIKPILERNYFLYTNCREFFKFYKIVYAYTFSRGF